MNIIYRGSESKAIWSAWLIAVYKFIDFVPFGCWIWPSTTPAADDDNSLVVMRWLDWFVNIEPNRLNLLVAILFVIDHKQMWNFYDIEKWELIKKIECFIW